MAQQVAKGLEAAHKKGVGHRDIKPQNIMVGEDGHVTIMDFGLAQLSGVSRLTRADQTMGTTAYMSPEQTQGSGTDHRTDIWSLGVVIYEMVTGQLPFRGDYDQAVMYSILNEEPEPITGLRTGVPVQLEEYVSKALAKKAEDRYQTASDLIVDLRTLADRLKSGRSTTLTAARTPAKQEATTSDMGAQSADPTARQEENLRWERQLDGQKLAGMVATSAGVGLAIFLYFIVPDKPVYLVGLPPVLVGVALLVFTSFVARRPRV